MDDVQLSVPGQQHLGYNVQPGPVRPPTATARWVRLWQAATRICVLGLWAYTVWHIASVIEAHFLCLARTSPLRHLCSGETYGPQSLLPSHTTRIVSCSSGVAHEAAYLVRTLQQLKAPYKCALSASCFGTPRNWLHGWIH